MFFRHSKYFVILFISFFINVNSFRRIREGDDIQILIKSNERFTLSCIVEESIDQCGFTHPNGTTLFLEDFYPGTPTCSIEVTATEKNIGKWICNTRSFTTKEMISRYIYVRQADRIAAVHPMIEVLEDDEIDISCVTTEGMMPLDKCTLIDPSGRSIVIEDTKLWTLKSSRLKYSLTPNKSVDRGECSLTVKVDRDLEGIWTCKGNILDEEYSDYIQVHVVRSSVFVSFLPNLEEYYDLMIYTAGSILVVLVIIIFIQVRRSNKQSESNRIDVWRRLDYEIRKSNKEIIC